MLCLKSLLVIYCVAWLQVGTPLAAPETKLAADTTGPILSRPKNSPPVAPPTISPASPSANTTAPHEASDAERIARLQRSVDTDESRLRELKRAINDPDSDFARAEKAFKELDAKLEATKHRLTEAQAAKRSAEVAEIEKAMAELAEPWRAAKTAFDLALEERRTKQANIATLEAKVARDKEAADKLLTPGAPPPVSVSPIEAAQPIVAPDAVPPAANISPTPITSEVAPVPAAAPAAANPAALLNPLATTTQESAVAPLAAPTPPREASQELKAATDRAEKLVAAAAEAEQEALSITQRLDLLKADIAQQRQLRGVALKKLDAAEDTIARLTKELEESPERGEKWDEVWAQLTEAQQRGAAARVEARNLADRLDDLQSELMSLQQDRLAALQEVDDRRKEADLARLQVAELNNPFSFSNLSLWAQTKGVIVLLAFLTLFSILRLGKYIEPRLTQIFISTSPRGSREERENRATTLVGVLLNVVRTVAVVVGVIIILEQFNVPVGPLLGGAAVVGLAVAFGAQSLIKDYFTGFMVLLEQQYMINDVVKIGEIKGQVERITMRMTVLRDLEGRVHFIPHGQITTVTNMTHGWSRTVVDVGVSYNEDVEHVMEVLISVGQELRHDPKFGQMMLENPEMLGIESLQDSAVIVRMVAKTRPLRQWEVKREWLKRIKRRFDELGIEIPYPHQTLYLRSAGKEGIWPQVNSSQKDAA